MKTLATALEETITTSVELEVDLEVHYKKYCRGLLFKSVGIQKHKKVDASHHYFAVLSCH